MTDEQKPDFTDMDQWLRYGYDQGWVGPVVCSTCDGIPASEDEYEYEAERCIYIMRAYEDRETKLAVERDHSPSRWRATNKGWPLASSDVEDSTPGD